MVASAGAQRGRDVDRSGQTQQADDQIPPHRGQSRATLVIAQGRHPGLPYRGYQGGVPGQSAVLGLKNNASAGSGKADSI